MHRVTTPQQNEMVAMAYSVRSSVVFSEASIPSPPFVRTSRFHSIELPLRSSERLMIFICRLLFILTLPMSIFFSYITLLENERAVMFRMGRLKNPRIVGPGLFFFLPFIDKYIKVDLRLKTMQRPRQTVLTKDAVSIMIDSVVFYRINDACIAATTIENLKEAIGLTADFTMLSAIATKTLREFLIDWPKIGVAIKKSTDEIAMVWGVEIERIEIHNISVMSNLRISLSVEAKTTRLARAHLASAKGDVEAAKSLVAAGDILAEERKAMVLRQLYTFRKISAMENKVVFVPIPKNLAQTLTNFIRK